MKAVILAGGLGTRLSGVSKTVPKPMVDVSGKSVLLRQILCLKKEGINDFLIITGYLGEVIENFFKDGKEFGVNIEYFREKTPLGTGGALFQLKDKLTEDFLLVNGDLIFDIYVEKFFRFHKEKNALVTLLTHPNDHPFDSSLIVEKDDCSVEKWISKDEKPQCFANRVNSGLHIVSPELLSVFDLTGKVDFDKDVLKKAVFGGRIFSYNSTEYVHDMGTPDRLLQVTKDIRSGIVEAKNLRHKQKAVFLDRDGTINKYKGYISSSEDIELIDGSGEAVRRFNQLGYAVIVITNQAVIARGDCTFSQLREIHNTLETKLSEKGAFVNAIYFCPHHPDKGFEGERIEYKIPCDCRKPKPGLILQAAKDFNIDISASYMIGDDVTDICAGKNAGCKTVFLRCGRQVEPPENTDVYDTLSDFAERIEDYVI